MALNIEKKYSAPRKTVLLFHTINSRQNWGCFSLIDGISESGTLQSQKRPWVSPFPFANREWLQRDLCTDSPALLRAEG